LRENNKLRYGAKKGDIVMTMRDTICAMQELLQVLAKDLEKSSKGNKAAARRVRVGTIYMEKLAKQYRKETVTKRKKIVRVSKKKVTARNTKTIK
jgi:hypothetical protein